jgi:mono/diheme cytochrome c family protein
MPAIALQPARQSHLRLALAAAVFALAALLPHSAKSEALSPSAQRGLIFVRTNCSHCHSVERVGESPLRVAPPFRTLHERYPVESLQESLAEGIVTGHPSMPEFQLDPGQVADVIAYLKSLER